MSRREQVAITRRVLLGFLLVGIVCTPVPVGTARASGGAKKPPSITGYGPSAAAPGATVAISGPTSRTSAP